ncbi:metallophosphoesterase [Lacimicrobium sp. SS2-24]|uniref:metallophosphoesterase n=1 Tax=Lacimicrobium sp. SS2-24 TaxID=2005569 RepID=UPI000B4C1829|nr:metallophosphoesterase [Lacimicrobium sp. SS2-24]
MTPVVQISDCHLFADPHRCGYGGINPYRSLKKVLSCVRALAPEQVLVTGDLSADLSSASYSHFRELWQQADIDAALHVIPGNHDEPIHLQQYFAKEMQWLQTPLKMHNWQIHGLNSHYKGTLGWVDENQLKQLRDSVMASPQAHHLVAVHHHPMLCHSWMDKHQWCNREAFLTLLQSLPQIRLVVHGHVHADLHWQVEQTQILACPSTCWQWQHGPDFGVDEQPPGLRLMKLTAQGKWYTEVIRCNG